MTTHSDQKDPLLHLWILLEGKGISPLHFPNFWQVPSCDATFGITANSLSAWDPLLMTCQAPDPHDKQT